MKRYILKAKARTRNSIGIFYPVGFKTCANSFEEAWGNFQKYKNYKWELYEKLEEKELEIG